MQLHGTRLDSLFADWIDSYPPGERPGFHRDGAIHEPTYWLERHRLVFIMADPSSRGEDHDHYHGWDLRIVLGRERLARELQINLGLWAHGLLDGHTPFYRLSPAEAQSHIRRVAVVNLKKMGGRADEDELSHHAMRDREFLLRELELLDPTLLVACGPATNRVLGQVCTGSTGARVPDHLTWVHGDVPVITGNSPSLRPYESPNCFERLMSRAMVDRVASFS